MAPRGTGKAKAQKQRGEKRKKEKVSVPYEVDIGVNLPDCSHVLLKAISTDRILDVRRLLSAHVDTCHLTRYSLHHEVRGSRLRDAQEVSFLKPRVLALCEEDYDEGQAVAHVRRLLDIMACVSCFGPSAREKKLQVGKQDRSAHGRGRCQQKADEVGALAPAAAVAAAKEATERGDMSGMCPPSELGQFYEFFSFAHLTPPLQFLRRTAKEEKQDGAAFFTIEVRLCNGKLATVTAYASGFHSNGKQSLRSHTLVALLKRLSQAFSKAYDLLLKAFSERNKFGNPPYGLRSNTWVVPPIAAEVPSTFHSLPTEDETWGGSGGGQGRAENGRDRPWAQEFAILARMPCGSVEERRIRDRKAFLLHNLFVDVAVTVAATTIQHLQALGNYDSLKDGEWHQGEVRNLAVRVSRDGTDASNKFETKIEGSHLRGKTASDLAERNLLKGITADENSTVQDQETFGVVVVRHRGYIAVVEAIGLNAVDTASLPDDFHIEDSPEGGANSLNVNSLRTLLHTKSSDSRELELEVAENQLEGVLQRSLARLESEESLSNFSIRLELAACWLQHLQTEADSKDVKATVAADGDQENAEEGKRTPRVSDTQAIAEVVPVLDAHLQLRTRLNEAAFNRLKQSGAGLHVKTLAELMDGAKIFYEEVALTKLVSDFSSLELAPVDGRSLSDFMHARGLQMRSLGRVAELAAKLPHVQSLCEHEMVTRALKHVVRASVASSDYTVQLAPTIASIFNFAFGSWPTEEDITCRGNICLWNWVETFVRKRYNWTLRESTRSELRKCAVLRGLCHKVGIEIAARNYNMDSPRPFANLDIISMVPVYKHVSCSSADGRTLLESCKAALDKGKGDEAIKHGVKALNKLMYVCGPYHRMTAGAYSLLAVVLYHTGDYNQATIYQQKALDINERELGLDHPDTIKSYGDVAVFYYRLQHTELAVKYVTRALYLLHLICGPSHPNSAATYINVAMMEEGLGNIDISLRYLHEALTFNQRLLGPDHTQTAASFHAMAIVLSMMEAYTLSVQHEQTTLQILEGKLGAEDPRTQDSAAWLQYFDSKAAEQQEAARKGAPKADMSIAVKGHLSVADLVEYIGSEVSDRGTSKGVARRPIKSKGKGSSVEGLTSAELDVELSSVSSVLPEARVCTATIGEGMCMESQPLGIMEEMMSPTNVNCAPSQGKSNGVSEVNGRRNSLPDTVNSASIVTGEQGKVNVVSVANGEHASMNGVSVADGEHAAVSGVPAVNGERSEVNGVSVVNGDGISATLAFNAGFLMNGTASELEANVSSPPVISKEDEGWQEAAHRGRSAHGNGRRNGIKGSFIGVGVKKVLGNREVWEVGGRRYWGVPNGSGPANGNTYHDRSKTVKPALHSRPGSPGLANASETSRKVILGPGPLGKQQLHSKVAVPGADSLSSDPKVNGATNYGAPTAMEKTVSENCVPSRSLNAAESTPARSPRAGISYKDAALALHVDMRPPQVGGKVNDTDNEPIADGQAHSSSVVKNVGQDEMALQDNVDVVEKTVILPGKRWADVDFDVNDKPSVLGERILNGISYGVAKACDNGFKAKHSNGVERPGHKDNGVMKDLGRVKGGSKVREEKQKLRLGGSLAKVHDNGHAAGHGNGYIDNSSRVKAVVQNGHSDHELGRSEGASSVSEVKSETGTAPNGLSLNSNGHHVSEASTGHEAIPAAEAATSNSAEWNITFGRVKECDIEASVETANSGDAGSHPSSEAVGESKEYVEPFSEVGLNGMNGVEGQPLGVTDSDCGDSPEQMPGKGTGVSKGDMLVQSTVEEVGNGELEACREKPARNHHVLTKLSASAPAFTPTSKPVTRVVAAVTPFKAGKAPVPAASTVRSAVLSTIPTTIAVTPIKKTSPPLVSSNGHPQVPGGLTPHIVPTSGSIVQPESSSSFGKWSASAGSCGGGSGGGNGGVIKARVVDEKRVTMNPNAMEYIPRTMNPNAAVFVPSRMLGFGEAVSNKSGSSVISEGSGVVRFFVRSQDDGSSVDGVIPSPSVAADATAAILLAQGRKDESSVIESSKVTSSSTLNPDAECFGNSEELSS